MKRSRELKPLSSEHHQVLLVAFQVRQGLEGHGESVGAPKDLPGLATLAVSMPAGALTTSRSGMVTISRAKPST